MAGDLRPPMASRDRLLWVLVYAGQALVLAVVVYPMGVLRLIGVVLLAWAMGMVATVLAVDDERFEAQRRAADRRG